MDTIKIAALLAKHGDESMMPLVESADAAGWGDVYEYLRIGYSIGLNGGGLWQCEHCHQPIEDPAHPDSEVGCHILDDESGCGNTILCDECYEAAVAARKKIVVTEIRECDISDSDEQTVIGTKEDDSALTADEKTLAAYLDAHQTGISRNARSHIAGYPRGERWQLHRYQDQIDADAAKRGKTVR